jgi:SAM-dependent methyltransferase
MVHEQDRAAGRWTSVVHASSLGSRCGDRSGWSCTLGTVHATDETREFYDRFFDHLLYDRLRLNPRHAMVERLVDRFVPRGATVLDLGCGIGITSELLARRAGSVVAVDLAPKLIDYARATVRRVRFEVGDVATFDGGATFDVVCLFDVFEHIPRDGRPALWQNVVRQLAPDGLVLMTVPHPAATEQTTADDPDALQIVDEVVHPDELLADARAAGLSPRTLETYGVDRMPEYVWLVLERLRPPRSTPRRRWAAPLAQLRVRARARRYWRLAGPFRAG